MRAALTSLALFCKVVDNFGDIGICWRLARQLQQEHGIEVTLWVDDLLSFQRLCPEVRPELAVQHINGIRIQHWRDQLGVFTPEQIADIVIEFFACDIPPGYINAMAQCAVTPVWFNLEGLSAEAWVEGCHALSSPHGSLPLTKYFFFPGFNANTGGLLLEADLVSRRQQFQQQPGEREQFLARLGVTPAEMAALTVSLFCYPHAPVAELLSAWEQQEQALTCLVPEGVASDSVSAFLGQSARAGCSATRGALTLRVIPFLPQQDYDRLLWSCDCNFVRGEDSFVRAQWAGRAFIWHIYPQDENLHHVKLKAFLRCHSAQTDSLTALSLGWNQVSPVKLSQVWSEFQAELPKIALLSADWQRQMQLHGDLASNLLKFAQTVRKSAAI